ncbi:MFS transporter [Planococcus versutus]|nr:MFS transporter [Planococcus versutus]
MQPFAGSLIADQGWRSSYMILGVGAFVVIVLVILLLIRKNPEDKGLLPYGMKDASASDFNAEDNIVRGVTFANAKKSLAFYSMFLFLFFMTAVGSFAQHIAPYAIVNGYTIEFAGQVLGYFMIGMLVGSLAFGFLTDKMGVRNTGYMSMSVGIISVLLLIFIPGNAAVFSVGIGLFGFVTASIGTLGPLLTTAIFGTKEYSQIYATIAIGLATAGIVALPGYGYIYDITGNYQIVLYMIIAMLIINIILITFAFKGKKILESKGQYN